ncbi:alpha/beta hydrolase [Phreatobacter aquaticus]|uniref:Alpha/beta hydrolase n=1 Tax=Phreatobacter aquaticus TaxID=2570229 RepID=A0A4D7QHT7_9HYPH|nr:alpha/beta hydrolase [Phreatobacter aquaticus]QCK85389.1 alpha/beta hydrolase [Phreatobacter aquaticus]
MHIPRRHALSLLSAGAALLPFAPARALAQLFGGQALASDVSFGPAARHKLDIYAPPRDGTRRPVVLFIYGGSWSSGSKETYGFVGQALAARGFVTVIADYRLVPEVRFPGFVEDGALALRFIRQSIATYGGDPQRISVLGHSAGAYNAVMLALDPRFLAGAGVPPGTIRRVAALSGPYDFLPLDHPSTIAAFGQTRDLSRTQPVNLVRRGAPPMLLGTGTADTTVLPRNSEALARRLQAAGSRVELRRYEGVGHPGTILAFNGFLSGTAPTLADVTRFLGAG